MNYVPPRVHRSYKPKTARLLAVWAASLCLVVVPATSAQSEPTSPPAGSPTSTPEQVAPSSRAQVTQSPSTQHDVEPSSSSTTASPQSKASTT